MYKNEKEIENRVREHYNELIKRGFEVVFLALQGSQNYGLEYEGSDVDTKAVILPKFEDFVNCKQPYSETIVLDNEEHIDTKDIRCMFENFKKMNISYIELLYSEYIIINPKYERFVKFLLENREEIATINKNQFLRCLSGMSMEKLKALCHPYPTIKHKIDKYGFDGKQLCHCARLNEFIIRYTNGEPLQDCYKSKQRDMLINFKKNLNMDGTDYLPVEKAIQICTQLDADTKRIKNENLDDDEQINTYGLFVLDTVKTDILMQWFKEELLKK